MGKGKSKFNQNTEIVTDTNFSLFMGTTPAPIRVGDILSVRIVKNKVLFFNYQQAVRSILYYPHLYPPVHLFFFWSRFFYLRPRMTVTFISQSICAYTISYQVLIYHFCTVFRQFTVF